MNIFILTGAGISADSGLKTFRDNETGIWENHKIEDVCVKGCFEKNPQLVTSFYDTLRNTVDSFEPNESHYAIAKYISKTKHNVMLVTQNIDNYHEIAFQQYGLNPNKIVKLHGDLYKMFCIKCGFTFKVKKFYSQHDKVCVDCGETDTIRPDVTFFDEEILSVDMNAISHFLSKKTNDENLSIFVSIGTSGNVYPAAYFIKKAHYNASRIFFNINEGDSGKHFYHQKKIGKAVDHVPHYFEELYEKNG